MADSVSWKSRRHPPGPTHASMWSTKHTPSTSKLCIPRPHLGNPAADGVRSPAVAPLHAEPSRSISLARSTTASPAAPTAIPWTSGLPSAAYPCTRPPSISAAPPVFLSRGSPILRPHRPCPNPSQFHFAPHRATTKLAPTRRETGPVSGRDRHVTRLLRLLRADAGQRCHAHKAAVNIPTVAKTQAIWGPPCYNAVFWLVF